MADTPVILEYTHTGKTLTLIVYDDEGAALNGEGDAFAETSDLYYTATLAAEVTGIKLWRALDGNGRVKAWGHAAFADTTDPVYLAQDVPQTGDAGAATTDPAHGNAALLAAISSAPHPIITIGSQVSSGQIAAGSHTAYLASPGTLRIVVKDQANQPVPLPADLAFVVERSSGTDLFSKTTAAGGVTRTGASDHIADITYDAADVLTLGEFAYALRTLSTEQIWARGVLTIARAARLDAA